jgi:hypothetical protein
MLLRWCLLLRCRSSIVVDLVDSECAQFTVLVACAEELTEQRGVGRVTKTIITAPANEVDRAGESVSLEVRWQLLLGTSPRLLIASET